MVLSIDTSALAGTRIEQTYCALFYVNWSIFLLGRQLLVQQSYYLSPLILIIVIMAALMPASILNTLHIRSSIGKV